MTRAPAPPASRISNVIAVSQLVFVVLFGVVLFRYGRAAVPFGSTFALACATFALAATSGLLALFGNRTLSAGRLAAETLQHRMSEDQEIKETLEQRVVQRTLELDDAQRVLHRMWWLGQQITLELDPRRVLDRFLEAAADVAQADGAALGLWTDEGMIEIAAASGSLAAFTGHRLPVAGMAMGRIMRSGGSWGVADVLEHRGQVHSAFYDNTAEPVRGMAIVPVQRRGERIGAVTIACNDVRTFTPLELERVEAMADLMSVALANAELFQTMKQAEWRFRTLFRAAPDAVLTVLHATGRIREANDAVRDVFGIEPQHIVGRAFGDLILDSDRETFDGALAAAFEGIAARVEVQVHLPHGGTRAVALAASRLPEADPPSVLLIGRDMTHEREMRVRLMESDRLAAVGELVAGVAHEVNNPLSSISAFAQLLLRDATLSPSQRESIDVIRSETTRASQVVKDLLAFARRSEPQQSPLDLNAVIARTVRMRQYQFSEASVRVATELSDDLPAVMGDARQLQQVCLNLLTNAVQAMTARGGGDLTVRSYVVDDAVRLEVSDSGQGIASNIRAHIFEPFFTTKKEGEGTGLGLSVSYGIVTAHGGEIEVVESSPSGTTFRVTLPSVSSPAVDSVGVREGGPFTLRSPLAGIRLLFVDDEPALRSGMEAFGIMRGFTVVVASDGKAALEAALSRGVDAVVCDLRMPGMDGYAFHERLRLERPGLAARTVFVTGDVVTTATRGSVSRQPVLTKPFAFDMVEEALIAVMRGSPYVPTDRAARATS